MKGTLYLVGVPIGHWDDITLRALEVLKNTAVIAAEDTRKAKKLLARYGITPPRLVAHHAANERASAAGVLKFLREGQSVAYISDAGMPGISDPGFLLARAAREEGVAVAVIPGVSAVPTALLASNLPCDRFCFMGFLPRKSAARRKTLTELAGRPETLVFYEAPHRLVAMLADAGATLGEGREATLCRELTKTHEEILPGTLGVLHGEMAARSEILGEITLVVAGAGEQTRPAADPAELDIYLLELQKKGLPPKEIKKLAAEKFGLKQAEVYKRFLALAGKSDV